jgi:uncharacterized membrane protein YkoI
MRKLIIPLAVLLVLAVYISNNRNKMQLELSTIQTRSDSLYYEIETLKYQNQRYEFIYDQLSNNPEVIRLFNETE